MGLKLTALTQETENLPKARPNLVLRPRPAPLRVISVTSGKGGVGKSNIVVNLGLALAHLGQRVLLIDADLGLANLDILLGLTPQFTMDDVLSLRKTIGEVLVEGPGGVKILPASSGIPELAELDQSQKMVLLQELDHYAEDLDVVLIDTGAGISRNVLFFNLAAPERLVVVNNEPTSLTDAYALIKVMATRHEARRFKLVVNSISHPEEAEKVYLTLLQVMERFLGGEIVLEYLGVIPRDEAVPKAVRRQQAVLARYPESPAGRAFTAMARKLWEESPPADHSGNLNFFGRRLLQCRVE